MNQYHFLKIFLKQKGIKVLLCSFLVGILSTLSLHAQNISINESGAAPDNSAMLDITANDKGVLIPRMTAAQRLAIPSPANGLLVFQTDIPRGFYAYIAANTVWTRLTLDSTLNLERVLLGGNDAANNAILNVSRIGVGTNAPISEIHVIRNQAASRSDGAFIDIQNSSGVNRGLAGLRFKVNSFINNQRYQAAIFHRWTPPGTYQLNFAVRDNSTTTLVDTADIKMTINHFGRVGIGTTSPSENLHLSTSVGDANLLIEADTDNNDETDNPSIRLEQDGGIVSGSLGFEGNAGDLYTNSLANGMYVGTFSNYPFQILTNGTANMTFSTNGRVGVGTTSPSRKFHVHEEISATSFGQFTTATTGQGLADGFILGYTDAVGAVLFNAENSNLAFGTNNNYRMWLNPLGNLGIGTSTPLARLHLSGADRLTGIVESSNIAGTWMALRNSSVGGQYHQIISTGSGNGEGPGKMLFGYGTAAGTVNGIAMTMEDTRVGVGITDPVTRLHLNHISGGPSTGFSLSNQSGGADRWHFYVFTTDQLALYFNDNQRGTFNEVTGIYSSISDVKLKKNIKVINDSFLNRLKKLEVKEYHFLTQNESEQKYMGFIAQELKNEFPSLVTVQQPEDSEGEILHLVDYSGLSVVAIKAIQEQQVLIDQLLEEVTKLKYEINQLKSEK